MDNNPKSPSNSKVGSNGIERVSEQFDFELRYRPGGKYAHADGLSRQCVRAEGHRVWRVK